MTRARDTANIIGNLDAVTAGDVVTVDANGNPESAGTRANPNLIINGGFDVWQRGTSFSSQGYTADRWYVYNNTTASRSTDVPTADVLYSITATRTSGSTLIQTPLELSVTGGAHPFNPDGTYTLSFWAKTTAGQNVQAYINYQDTVVGGAQVVGASPIYVGTGGWVKYEWTVDFSGVTSLPTSTCLVVGFTTPVNIQLQIAQVKLEQGSVATPWFYEDYGTTLAKCMRYYQTYTTTTDTEAIARLLTNTAQVDIKFPVEMRVLPAVTVGNVSGIIINNNGTNVNPASYTAASRTNKGFRLNLTGTWTATPQFTSTLVSFGTFAVTPVSMDSEL